MMTYSLTLPIKDPLQKVFDQNYKNKTGNALTNPRGFMERTVSNINSSNAAQQIINQDLVSMAQENYKSPNEEEEQGRKFVKHNRYNPASDPLSGSAMQGGARGRQFSPLELAMDVRRNKLAMGQGLQGLLQNKPKTGGLLSG